MPSRRIRPILGLRRRALLASSLAAPALLAARSRAETVLPDKALRLLTGFQANGGTDVTARLIAASLERRLGRHIVVENKPGNNGTIPGELAMHGPKDGSMLAFLASTTLVSKLGQRDFPFDPLVDLAPISLAGTWPMGLAVSPKIGVSTFKEYLDWMRAGDSDRHRLGNTASNAFIEAFNLMFARELVVALKVVPYRGTVPMINDLADGRLPAAASGMVSLLEHHRGGRLRLLMTSGPDRLEVAKDIPAARELGVGSLETVEWFAFFAPAGTPEPVIEEWHRHIDAVMSDPDVAGAVKLIGMKAKTSSPGETRIRIAEHMKHWKARMLEVGMAPLG
ncbi:MAG TPA: tripartite tricarboxylate transporter substrate-binding protein [Reyranella sp.]|nr:tripartite tricarboxylate transporter substrate-binding protein [Reyranella sp.]